MQAEDRAHRIGQTSTVSVEYLLSPTTVDDWIWASISRKLDVLNKVGLSKENMKLAPARSSDQPVLEDFFEKVPKDEFPNE